MRLPSLQCNAMIRPSGSSAYDDGERRHYRPDQAAKRDICVQVYSRLCRRSVVNMSADRAI